VLTTSRVLVQMNNYTSIFRVGILDDLHNYFPDLLYNSDRFRSVQDVLRYIQQGARTNPFEQGLREYNRSRDNRDNRDNQLIQPIQIPIIDASGVSISQQIPETPVRQRTAGTGEPPAPSRRRPVMYWADNRYDINNIDTSLLTNLFTMALNPTYTDVSVVPTNGQVDAATTIAISRVAEQCAICQDSIEPTQSIRRINRCQHVFHRPCIDTWFESGVTCPICRIDIRE
jgi:hypothetical protein